MGFFRRKSRGRILRNGAQQEVLVLSAAGDVTEGLWWGDTYALVHGLSDGDRSTFQQSVKATANGNKVNMLTVPDTCTNELWTRLSVLGYFDPAPVPAEIAALPITSSMHVMTAFGADRGPWFFGAAQALMNDLDGATPPVVKFAEAFLQLDKLHAGIRLENLNILRDMLFRNEQGLRAEGNTAFEAILQRYTRAGAVRADGPDRWSVTPAGSMIGPFMLDRIVSRRQRQLH